MGGWVGGSVGRWVGGSGCSSGARLEQTARVAPGGGAGCSRGFGKKLYGASGARAERARRAGRSWCWVKMGMMSVGYGVGASLFSTSRPYDEE